MTEINKVIFSNHDDSESASIESYINIGGYSAWKKIIDSPDQNTTREKIINEVKEIGRASCRERV